MKHFFLASLFPALLTAQSMQLTKQLGKTVLYGDIAVSPDGAHLAWTQSTAANLKPKQTYVCAASGNSATVVKIPTATGDRVDAESAWAPNSKTLVFFSTAGEKDDQRQLWT